MHRYISAVAGTYMTRPDADLWTARAAT